MSTGSGRDDECWLADAFDEPDRSERLVAELSAAVSQKRIWQEFARKRGLTWEQARKVREQHYTPPWTRAELRKQTLATLAGLTYWLLASAMLLYCLGSSLVRFGAAMLSVG